MLKRLIVAAMASATLTAAAPAFAAEGALPVKDHEFSFEGPFGTFDRASLQRGFQVYKEVCASCHSLNYVAYRNLAEPGGPEYSMAQAEAVAAEARVPAGPDDNGNILDEDGFLRTRPGLPSDRFAAPYPNELAARAANNGALPPDLSLITKARHHGPHYVFSLVSGYKSEAGERPDCIPEDASGYYNPYFGAGLVPDSCKDEHGHVTIPGSMIGMAPPLPEDRVTYADGTPATVEQMAADVATFLTWAAEPHMEARKKLGFKVMIYLLILTGFLYLTYKAVWRGVEH